MQKDIEAKISQKLAKNCQKFEQKLGKTGAKISHF